MLGHLKIMNFPFGTNGKFIILGVPILKHIRVFYGILQSNSWPFIFNGILESIFYGMVNYGKVLLHKISWKVLKIFA